MASNNPLQTPAAIPLLLLLHSFPHSLSLSPDGALLLAFRYAILSDPLSLLQNWRYSDPTPCSWTGVTCQPDRSRVTRLDLPNAHLLGSVAPELGLLDQLLYLDLSGNFFNGTLPPTLFNASKLQTLSLANNAFSGEVPASIAGMTSLRNLNLSGNALSGDLPRGLGSGEILDLSSNLFNGSVPSDIGGASLTYLNLSSNKLSGGLLPDLGKLWPENATVDLSFNNLTGQIPEAKALVGQKSEAFAGNSDLCGKPLKDQCMIPSTLSTQPKASGSISPAIAVIPRSVDSDNSSNNSSATPLGGENHTGLRPTTIVGITVADLAGIGLLGLLLMYVYRWRKSRAEETMPAAEKYETYGGGAAKAPNNNNHHQVSLHFSATPIPAATTGCCCIKGADMEAAAATTDGRSSSGNDNSEGGEDSDDQETTGNISTGGGKLVMVDGETEMEMEMLMKASAYILGTSGSSIVYKAVLQDGTAFAVRRMGECGAAGERLKRENFEGQVRAVAKLRHPNVVRMRGFYWGSTEKLVISDFVSNGSLASISGYKTHGSSPCHLSLKVRMKIARGVARGLNHIHEKKLVHGNLKPNNILLTPEMEPIIGDLGMNWIIHSCKGGAGSGRHFGSKRSIAMAQYDVAQELSVTVRPMDNGNGPTSPYQPPELLKSIKASPKWDVYSFGVILLELLTGKVFFDRELGQWTPGSGIEDKYWALRMADVAIRADVQGREEAMVGVFKLGFQCASMVPQKRPSMREALQVLEKIPLSSNS